MTFFNRLLVSGLFLGSTLAIGSAQQPVAPAAPPPPGLALSSTAFDDGGVLPDKYTQQQPAFVSPPLQWVNIPKGTLSFALLVHDQDVALMKKYSDVLHWLIFNIPAEATSLPEGVPTTATLPDASVQLKNQRGTMGFLGPGAGANGPYHHYTFELFALDTKLTLGPDATRDDFAKAIDGHILGKGVTAARFRRH